MYRRPDRVASWSALASFDQLRSVGISTDQAQSPKLSYAAVQGVWVWTCSKQAVVVVVVVLCGSSGGGGTVW